MHNRRARPTLRVLREDLNSDWGSPQPRRALEADRLEALHPLSELPHPIVEKALDCFTDDPQAANFIGPIRAATQLRLLEIKKGQWRGGIWQNPLDGVNWLLVAGLAKGDHEDFEDFYKRVERENASGNIKGWLPTPQDVRLLKRETAARLRTEWELRIQRSTHAVLRRIHSGGAERLSIQHPRPDMGDLAEVEISITPVRESGYEADEVFVEVFATPSADRDLIWSLTLRILITLEPPEQGWDAYRQTYSTIGEPGAWERRLDPLTSLVNANELGESKPGKTAHYSHRRHLAGSTIEGKAVRALCGSFFVPRQDHDTLPQCATCAERLNDLPS